MQQDKGINEMISNKPFPLLLRLFFMTVLIFVTVFVHSQETGTCAEKLKNAQSSFEKGQVEEVPALLKDCLKSGFTWEEELSAYKLIIQTYLFNDKIAQADSAMLAFLKGNPEYQTSPTDHSSFLYLYNSFTVKPLLQITIHVGLSLPFFTFSDPNPLPGKKSSSSYSRDATNIFLSGETKINLGKRIELCLEIGYSQSSFTNIGDFMGIGTTNYTETRQRLEIPAGITYDFNSFGKFTPYGRLGIGAALNLNTTASASFVPTDRINPSRTGEDLNRKDSRVPVDIFGQIGAGVKFKIPQSYLFAEIRSDIGIMNQVVPGGESVPILEHWYFYKDAKFYFNSLNFNVGYTYIIYKPSKRKE